MRVLSQIVCGFGMWSRVLHKALSLSLLATNRSLTYLDYECIPTAYVRQTINPQPPWRTAHAMLQRPLLRSQVLYITPRWWPRPTCFSTTLCGTLACLWVTSPDLLQAFSQRGNQMASVGMFTACCHLGSLIRALLISAPNPRLIAEREGIRGWTALGRAGKDQKTRCQSNLKNLL